MTFDKVQRLLYHLAWKIQDKVSPQLKPQEGRSKEMFESQEKEVSESNPHGLTKRTKGLEDLDRRSE